MAVTPTVMQLKWALPFDEELQRSRALTGGGEVDGPALLGVQDAVLGHNVEQRGQVLGVGVDGGTVQRRDLNVHKQTSAPQNV